ncbi:MAG: hypothetical protein K2K90_17870 [Lachnospiraceae bacterium]|nr:hypothetical protein [Lachnospiraceae bacterium]
MGERKDNRRKTKYFACFMILWILQMAAAFWFCTRKQGFHEDEFYTYYSTARTNGFYVEDGKWMERDAYRNEFVVLPEERFQYRLVKQVQSWDVHPPMYYWVFHTVASFVPGVFSKWIGLSVNLLFHGVNLILLTYLSYLAAGRNWGLPLLVTFVYGFSPAAMSGVVFIRMYEMLTTFVLLCAVLHVRAVMRLQGSSGRGKGAGREKDAELTDARQENRLPAGTLLAMAAVTYVGFLTQYYYFIFLFFMAVAFGLWLFWRDRKIANCLRYGLFQGLAFVLAYLTYPAFPGQMFRGQRGAQATENFFDLSNTFERLRFFWDLMNRYVFGGLFGLMLLFLAAAAVAARVADAEKRRKEDTGKAKNTQDGQPEKPSASSGAVFYMLLFTAAGYFLAVSKTALLLGDTSNRYQLPIYGIVVLLLVLGAAKTLRQIAGTRYAGKESRQERGFLPARDDKYKKRIIGVAAAFGLAVVALGYVRADVVFLYPEAKEETALARVQAAAQIPVVYVYNPGEEWCIWAVADELMEYDRVYFVSDTGGEPVTEPSIVGADAVVAYLPRYDDVKDEAAQNMRIPSGNGKLSEVHLQHSHKYCNEWYYGGDGAARSGAGDLTE